MRSSAMWCVLAALIAARPAAAQSATIGGVTFSNKGLVGVGRIADSKKDKFGETFGSLSGLALDLRSVQRNSSGSTFTATLYAQPDRGFVKSGVTLNYRARVHKIALSFKPDTNGSSDQDQLTLTLSDTTLLTESDGHSLTGLDPSATSTATRAGFTPKLPVAFNGNLSLDAEGLVLLPDGGFFVSDEYGPYLYRFNSGGVLIGVIRPPEALVPKRNNVDSFSSDNPATGQPNASPSDPIAGRANNKGLEGLSLSADGHTLYALMQAAPRQETSSGQNRFTRLLAYDITNPAAPALTGEWVLTLPLFSSNPSDVAEAHELVALTTPTGTTKFLVLAHDGNGRGATVTKSTYRAVLVFDMANATNIAGKVYDNPSTPLVLNGILANDVTPAPSVVLVDLNDATQLAKFGLNNNANDNSDTLAASWESLALVPALDASAPDDFFLLIGNDNNFSTSSGFQDGSSYNASPNLDTMVLAYRVTLPGTGYTPIITTQPPSAIATLPGQTLTLTAAASGSPAPTFQWSKNGSPISNATGATLSLPNVQIADNGSYSVLITNANGSVTSTSTLVNVADVANAPNITRQPVSQTITTGGTVVFSVTASNALNYQWSHNNSLITGATSSFLVIPNAQPADAGSYAVTVSGSSAIAFSTAATLTLTTPSSSNPGRLTNLSVLTDITASVSSFTVGTVIASGTAPKALVIRAAGPSLGALGVPATIADPQLTLFNSSSVAIAPNDNWGGDQALLNAMASVGAFAFTGPTSKDAAVFRDNLQPGNFSVTVSGVNGATGTAIAEIYDADAASGFTITSSRLTNVSVLKSIVAGGSLTLGFTLGGPVAKTVLIRVIGPGLAAVNLPSGTLGDPQLTLFNSSSQVIATNDDWGADAQLTTAASRVGAFAIGNAATKDAMLIVTLPPGGYTAQAKGNAATSGLAIVEVYEVP